MYRHTKGKLIWNALSERTVKEKPNMEIRPITSFRSGPLGGDQQLGAFKNKKYAKYFGDAD